MILMAGFILLSLFLATLSAETGKEVEEKDVD